MPLNDSGKEITEDDDIFIDDPKQLVSLVIIPLLRHFTIFGQENAQNMRR